MCSQIRVFTWLAKALKLNSSMESSLSLRTRSRCIALALTTNYAGEALDKHEAHTTVLCAVLGQVSPSLNSELSSISTESRFSVIVNSLAALFWIKLSWFFAFWIQQVIKTATAIDKPGQKSPTLENNQKNSLYFLLFCEFRFTSDTAHNFVSWKSEQPLNNFVELSIKAEFHCLEDPRSVQS